MGQYSLLPNEQGGVVDDIIVYRIREDEFAMVVNAANHAKDVAWITENLVGSVQLNDETDGSAMIAVQGPDAVSIVSKLSMDPGALTSLPMFGVAHAEIAGIPCFAARSGYTGEDGFELVCDSGNAEMLWRRLLAAGVVPCGLASRDTLRVEAGLPLYGHELSDSINPMEAGLGWVVSKSKSFIGSDPINAMRESGPARKLQGIRLETKRLLSPGMPVLIGDVQVGEMTSGVYSPLLECGIGFAMLDATIKTKTSVEVDMRGKRESGTVVNKRFFKRPEVSA
jgi:aminomethyltransferase